MIEISTIKNSLRQHHNLEINEIHQLHQGADINAATYKVKAKDQSSYFVKVTSKQPELNIFDLLKSADVKEVIYPLATAKVGSFYLTVFPFVDGQNGFIRPLTPDQWIRLGKALSKIHETKPKIHIRHENFSPKWRNFVKSVFEKHGETELESDFLNFLKKHRSKIEKIVNTADHLGKQLQQNLDFVLCHADIHAGNVLLTGDQKLYIVDWDNPRPV